MKNYLTLVLALAVVSSPAYASRARLEALGEGKNGSYYIDDARNMFLNPASIAKNKKKLFLELGGEVTAADQDASGADSSTSRPQGGFTNTLGDFTYAVYLNNVSDRAINTLTGGGLVAGLVAPTNSIEVALAGEGAVNWGLSVFTGGNRNGVNTNTSYWAARFGVEKDAAALFGTVGISSKAVDGAKEIKGDLSLDLGATYKIDSMTVYGRYSTVKATANASAIATGNEGKQNSYGVGAGWKKEMTKSTNMFTRVELAYSELNNSNATVAALKNHKLFNVPLVLGAETQALSWLAIRGSIAQSLTGANIAGNSTYITTPTVGAGVGMTFGDIQIDGMVASSAANGNIVDNTGFGTGTNSGSDFGFGDAMISRIGLTYNF
jgi:hypothetical protein